MSVWEPEPPISFEAFGVRVELTLGDPDLEPDVSEILPPGRTICTSTSSAGRFGLWPSGDDSYEVTFDGAPLIERATRRVALTMLDAELRLFVAARAPHWLFVHAGTVAIDGRALLIPGESFSGKTTLVAALVQAGARYYSDEYAVLDEGGRVHPYPRPLRLRGGDGFTPGQRVDTDRGHVGDEPAVVGVVALTRFRPGCEWKPRPVSRGHGIVALMAQTVPARERPERSLRALRRAIGDAVVLEGDRGEAAPVAIGLLEELRSKRNGSGRLRHPLN